MTQPPATTARALRQRLRRTVPVGWDWTDVVLAVVAFLAGAVLLLGILYSLEPSCATTSVATCHGADATRAQVIDDANSVVGELLFLVVLIAILRGHGTLRQLGWTLPRPRWYAAAPFIGALTVVCAGLLQVLNQRVLPQSLQGNDQCSAVKQSLGLGAGSTAVSAADWIIAIVLVCVIPPICEETAFRGFIYGWMRKRLAWPVAAVLSAVVFAAVHGIAVIFVPLFFVGLVLAVTYELSGSLLPGMIVHGTFNLINLYFLLNGAC